MAEGDASVYNNFKEMLLLGKIDLSADTLKLTLLGSGYSFVATGNPAYTTISGDEITATGYTSGGETLGSLAVTQDDTANRGEFDAADVTWTSLAATTIAHAVLWDDSPTTPVADPLLIRWEIGTNSNGGDYTLSFHTDGILLLS
jgi:hypothetical protein